MKFSLIICTYKRLHALTRLLESVHKQTLYPSEILVIDGSPDDDTSNHFKVTSYQGLKYYKVPEEERGLTKQRNFGVHVVDDFSEVVCFLDDDTILETNYFYEIIKVFNERPEVSGVGGVAVNENRWELKKENTKYNPTYYYEWEGYVCKEGQRNVVRNRLGLSSPLPPGQLPAFSHGRTMGYPLTGKVYEVDLLVGMSMAFRTNVVKSITFSRYFEGYGLYEDADFSIRALKFGKNVIATEAKLQHLHDASGRPDMYKYGKMVARNGWYVWRVKYPSPGLGAVFKWNAITWVLIAIRATNIINTQERKEAFDEVRGRVTGWFSLWFNKPKFK